MKILYSIIVLFFVCDDLFEFDLPSDYANMSYNGLYVFANKSGKKGMIIYTKEDRSIKKSTWDIDKSDLDNEDYTMIKKSFKLKDATTNFKALYIIGIIVLILIGVFFKFRKSLRPPKYNAKNEIDYKNLTEDDFNRMN